MYGPIKARSVRYSFIKTVALELLRGNLLHNRLLLFLCLPEVLRVPWLGDSVPRSLCLYHVTVFPYPHSNLSVLVRKSIIGLGSILI